jgi:type I restriction enzyme S subunit
LKEKLIEEKKRQKKYLMQQIFFNRTFKDKFSSQWDTVELQEIFEYEQPTKYLVETTDYSNKYSTPVLTAGKSFVLGYTNEVHGIYKQVPAIIFDDFTTDSKYVDFPFKAKSSAMKIMKVKENYDIRFAFELLQSINYVVCGHERHWISVFSHMTVDVPSYEAQVKISRIIEKADKEIKLLEQDLNQEKQKKKALMQLLLTGIVSVEVNE